MNKPINKHRNTSTYYVVVCKSDTDLSLGSGEVIPAGTEYDYQIQYCNRLEIRYHLWAISHNGSTPLRIEVSSGTHNKPFCMPYFYGVCHRKLARRWGARCKGYRRIVAEHPELKDWDTNQRCDHCYSMDKKCKA